MVGVVIGDLFLRKMYRFKPRWLKAPLSPALYHVHCVPLPHMNMFKFLSLTVVATKPLMRLRFHVKTKILVRFLDKKKKQLLFASMHCMSPSMSQARMYPSPLFLLNLQQAMLPRFDESRSTCTPQFLQKKGSTRHHGGSRRS